MSRLLERLKREKAEKEERRLERERKKKEKEAEKKKLAREKRIKRKKKMYNRRAYLKRRKVEVKEREKRGDVYGFHMVIIMKNGKRIKSLGSAWWRLNAFEIYNNAIKENRQEVKFPVEIYETNEKKQKQAKRSVKVKYEIMIIKKVADDESNISHFRDEDGKFEECVIKDDTSYKIIAKDDWYVEETFNVYGYHPYKDRKTYDFIKNEMLLKETEYDDIKRVFHFNHRLIIQSDTDIDIITCKTPKEAERLHNFLEKDLCDKPNIFFTGKLKRNLSSWILNEIEEKTGWSRQVCLKNHSL